MQKNDEITLNITSLTDEGHGVGRFENMAVFVPKTAIGDTVKVHLVKVCSSYAIGKAVEIITPSGDRVAPLCPHFDKCGGCSYWHISYEAEALAKMQNVKDAVRRIGKIDAPVLPIVTGKEIAYRNKACFPVGCREDGELFFGFFAPRSHRLVPCEQCKIQSPLAIEVAEKAIRVANEMHLTAYNEQTNKGLLRHLYIRTSVDGKAHLTVVANGKVPKAFAEKVAVLCPSLVGVTANENRKNTNVILGDTYEPLWGKDTLQDTLCNLTFEISPASFYQVNHDQCETLYRLAVEKAGITKDDTVFDLYCGIGTMSELFAQSAKEVYGIEITPKAVENAKRNAEQNGIQNATFLCGDATRVAHELKEKGVRPTVVVVDPPRAGLTETLICDIAEMAPQRVVYVSCNPATMARDLQLFAQRGYQTLSVTPVDLFPRTAHVETVVLLSRA